MTMRKLINNMHTILTLILTMIMDGKIYKKNYTLHKNAWNWCMENLFQNELNIHGNDLHKNSLVINVNRVENMLTYEDDVWNKSENI
jgi:hypothetical protein